MAARRRRFWWAIAIVAAIIIGGTVANYVGTHTAWGRAKVVGYALGKVNHSLGGRGRLTVGVLRQVGLNGIGASNVNLLDSAGLVVIHVDDVRGSLKVWELWNKAIHIPHLELNGVRLDLRREFTGPFNLAHILTGGPKSLGPHLPGIGDDIRVDSLTLVNASITVQYPWAAHKMFEGRARDSVIAVRKKLHDIVTLPHGFLERRRITLPRAIAHSIVLTAPKPTLSSMFIDSLAATISDPAMRIVGANGHVNWTPDSLMLRMPSVRLPASEGTAEGRVAWNLPGPVRFDVTVQAQASLSDLGWVWDVMPTTGKGSAMVRMRTLDNPDDAEYALSKLDVSSMNSRVTGDIAVIVRPADLLFHSVDLSFAPMRSELARRLSYEAVPAEVKGAFRGRLVAAAGGPFTAFRVDRIDATFDDDQVPGARSSLRAAGLLGFGVDPSARGVSVSDLRLDLRSLKPLAPEIPPVDGFVTGSLLVNSGNLRAADVSNIVLAWTDGAGNVSNVSGAVQARYSGRVPVINTELALDPLTLAAFARIDTTFPLLAPLRGRVTANGPLDSLTWTALIGTGASGADRLNAKGTASFREQSWRILANTELTSFDVREWAARTDLPSTALDGAVTMSVAGGPDANGITRIAEARIDANIKQAEGDARPAFTFVGSGALEQARLRIDSASALLGGVLMEAHGALARDSSASDTMQVSVRADTLSAVRSQLTRLAAMMEPVDSAVARTLRSYAADTLSGDASISGQLTGSLPVFAASVAIGARDARVGAIGVGRVFGSLRADSLPRSPHWEAAATMDSITGIGKLKLSSADFRVRDASPTSGRLSLDVMARDTTALLIRGGYTKHADSLDIQLDSIRFNYDDVRWTNARPVIVKTTNAGTRVDSLVVRSNQGGVLALSADVPINGAVQGTLHVERFPAGEAVSFALGTKQYNGLLTGDTKLTGTRLAPLLSWNLVADSVGVPELVLPRITTDGTYADRRLVVTAQLLDTLKRGVHVEARVPIDLTIQSVPKRLLSETVDAELTADSVRLEAFPLRVEGVSAMRGVLTGRVAVGGSMDRPVANGSLRLDGFAASVDALGITPTEGHMLLRASQDSIILDQFRVRSGLRTSDTLSASGWLRLPRNAPATIGLSVAANNVAMSRQRDGTDLDLSGVARISGEVQRPTVSGRLFVPSANLILDPLGARAALDLNSAEARELLGTTEVPVAETAAQSLARLGRFANVDGASVALGDKVWVRTPEAAVKIGGELSIQTSGNQRLALEGEITANRGIYKLNLGAVRRNFTIDSGRVRFFGNDAISPAVDIHATHVVRVLGGGETPVHVALGGTIDKMTVTLTSDDEVFSGAPESEVISLLIFGAPTFALDEGRQSTVRAVTGILVPSLLSGVVEGTLQRLLPIFNTLQVNSAGGQAQNQLTSAYSLFDNLSIAAGKQLSDRAFLRLNTGVCRGTQTASRAVSLWYGIAAEYRVAQGLSAQVGADPGSAPCSRLGLDTTQRMQFGFDLFREWIF